MSAPGAFSFCFRASRRQPKTPKLPAEALCKKRTSAFWNVSGAKRLWKTDDDVRRRSEFIRDEEIAAMKKKH